jgi:hypothetical protein
MTFYPVDAPVPGELRTSDLLLQPLTPEHVQMDYEAVMASREQLLGWSNGLWPREGFTLAENLEDLQGHEQEHLDREAFTYTVMSPDATLCEGCVYINPWEHALEHEYIDATLDDIDAGSNEAVVTFWIRSGSIERDLDRQLVRGLLDWFEREWAFSRVVFMTNSNLPRQVTVLEDAGLQPVYTFGSPTAGLTWLFYGQG